MASLFKKKNGAAADGAEGTDGKGQDGDGKAGGDVEMTEKGKGGKGSEEAGGVGEMKRGDYMIHVYIEKAKEIKVPDGGTVDPIFEVSCLNQKAYSEAKDDIGGLGEVVWAEHIFIEAKNIEKKQAEDGKISIALQDKGFFKNSLIGLYEFDLSYIYYMKDHVMLHKWLAFSNPNSENYSEITGYLKLSINVTCTGDESVQIEEDDGPEDSNVLMPPSLNPRFFQIKMRFFQAQDIPPMDVGLGYLRKAKTDAYVLAHYKKKKLKTKVRTMEENGPPIDWNQEFWIPAQIPIISKRLVLKLMDCDDVSDEVIGSLLFDMQDIVDGKFNGKFFWKNVYGSPLNQSNSQAKRDMNENPELASNWKGRVLMQIECEETEKPVAKVMFLEDELISKAKEYTVDRKYQIIAEVGQAVALPYDDKFSVKIIVGGEVFETQKAKVAKKDYNRFNERFEQRLVQKPYVNISDFGTVLVILMDDDKPICFYKEDIENFTSPNPEYKWVSFQPDMCVGKVKDANKAGMISFKMAIHDASEEEINFREHKSWKKMPPKRLEPVTIRAYIYQCRDLPAADSNGTSDPFVSIWDMSEGKPKRTQTIEDNNNPLYYEVLELDYEVRDINDLESYPPFILDVFDEDQELLDSSDDFLARAIVEPEDCSISQQKDFEIDRNLEIPPAPRWHPLRFMPGEPSSGDILVSFSVSAIDYNYMHPAKSVDLASRVEFKEFGISMLILGLRQLQSPGILPVKKAFIQFNLKSLVPPNSTAVQNIQTQPSASGPNPTINTTMNVTLPLPTDPLYCPKLSSTVYDYIFLGWNQPMIGVFTIPIGQYMLDLQEERRRETAVIADINEQLGKILEAGDVAVPNFVADDSGINKTIEHLVDSNRQLKPEASEAQLGADDFDRGQRASLASREDVGEDASKKRATSDLFKATKTRKPGEQRKSGAYGAALKGAEFAKDAAETMKANGEEADYQAQEQAANTIADIQERRRSSKADFLRKVSSSSYAAEDAPLLPSAKASSALAGLASSPARESVMERNRGLTKAALKKQLEEDKGLEKRLQEDERVRAQEDLIKQGDDAHKIIVLPKYKQDQRLKVDREVDPPPAAVYVGLGWDEDRHTHRKHYRQFYPDELENIKDIFPQKSPFNSLELKKGQSRGLSKGFFSSLLRTSKKDASGQDSTEKVVGYFKGIVEVESREDKYAYAERKKELLAELVDKLKSISTKRTGREIVVDSEALGDAMARKRLDVELRKLDVAHLQITQHLANLESDVILKRQLMAANKCVVRVYVISAFNLSSRDNGSASDPYLILKCNAKTYDERDNYQLDEPNPRFNKFYDFEGTFPGCSPLQIDVWDYDAVFGDDLIGTTIVDLEDRYFSLDWQSLPEKPVEYRQIYHQSSSQEQGALKCWVEINSTGLDPGAVKEWDISDKPPELFEVRICVFNAEEVEIMDIEGTSDVYFRGFFDSKEDVQETDTHFRNQDGKPDFQYRLVYRLQVPRKDYKFSLQAYDRDFFKSNDMIGEATVNLKNLIEDCSLVKKPLGLNEAYYDDVLKPQKFQPLKFDSKDKSRFWLKLRAKDAKTGKEEVRGKVKVQVDILPVDQADKNPVGKARDQPNHSPQLPQPEGRISFTLNPLKMFEQLVGPAMRRKIYCWCCIIACVAYCFAAGPIVFGLINMILSLK